MIRISLAAATLVLVSACASAPTEPTEPAIAAEPPVSETLSNYEQAIITVEGLVEAGNTQTAIDRLTQLLGDPTISDEDKANALFERGQLRMSEQGYDAWGAIADFEEIVNTYPQSPIYGAANEELGTARGMATSLSFIKDQPDATRKDKFDAHFALGEHEEAIALMQNFDFQPNNDQLVAMYQIGYLCEGDELTGTVYNAVEPDGSARALQFCDLGK